MVILQVAHPTQSWLLTADCDLHVVHEHRTSLWKHLLGCL